MKTVAAFLGLVAVVSAQGLSGLPTCAQQCATSAFPAECNLDIRCVCLAKQFIDGITCCVAEACSPEDQKSTIDFAHALCGGQGVHDLPEAAECTNSAAPSGSVSPTASTTLPPSSSPTSKPTETAEPTETASPTASPTPTAASPGGASSLSVGSSGVMAALAAALYAMA